MSQTEIVKVIEKNYDFFQASPSLFRGSEYRPKDFYFYCLPKRKANNERSERVKIIRTKTPSENPEYRSLRTEGQIMHKTEPSIDTNIQHLVPKPYYTKEGKFLAETEGTIRGTPSRSTQAGSYFDTPSSKEVSSRERLTTAPLSRIEEKVSLVDYGKGKIPSSLYQGTIRRKKLLAELQKGKDLRSLQEDPVDNKSVRSTQILNKNLSTRQLKQAKGTGLSIDASHHASLEFLSNSNTSKDKNGLVSKLRATVSNNFRTKAL